MKSPETFQDEKLLKMLKTALYYLHSHLKTTIKLHITVLTVNHSRTSLLWGSPERNCSI